MPRIAFCHRQTRNTTERHVLASGVSPHRPVSIKSPAFNTRHFHHYGAATIYETATRPLAQAAKSAAKAVATAVAKAGGGNAHNRPDSAQLVSADIGVHLCCMSGAGCPLTLVVCATAAADHACSCGSALAGVACGERWAKATGEVC